MNSIPKVSSLPIHKLISSTCSRSLGLGVHVVSPKMDTLAGTESENIVQVNIPAELKNALGFDKCFVETRGDQILAIAATKKLLMEEKLRKSLLSLNVPFNKILHDNRSPV